VSEAILPFFGLWGVLRKRLFLQLFRSKRVAVWTAQPSSVCPPGPASASPGLFYRSKPSCYLHSIALDSLRIRKQETTPHRTLPCTRKADSNPSSSWCASFAILQSRWSAITLPRSQLTDNKYHSPQCGKYTYEQGKNL